MALLSFKTGDDIKKLEAQLAKTQAATDRARAARVEVQVAMADVVDRLATAELYQDSTTTLQAERSKLADRLVAIDLAIARGEADAALLQQKISAAENRSERQAAAAKLEAQAAELEKALAPVRKAAAALAQAYFATPQIALDAAPGSTPQILGAAFPWVIDAFDGDAIAILIASIRQCASDILDGKLDANISLTIGARHEGMTGRKLTKAKVGVA